MPQEALFCVLDLNPTCSLSLNPATAAEPTYLQVYKWGTHAACKSLGSGLLHVTIAIAARHKGSCYIILVSSLFLVLASILYNRCCVKIGEIKHSPCPPRSVLWGRSLTGGWTKMLHLKHKQSMRFIVSAWVLGGFTWRTTFSLGFEGFIGVFQNHYSTAKEVLSFIVSASLGPGTWQPPSHGLMKKIQKVLTKVWSDLLSQPSQLQQICSSPLYVLSSICLVAFSLRSSLICLDLNEAGSSPCRFPIRSRGQNICVQGLWSSPD